MPTYEYQCDACGHKFDQFQSIKAEPLKKCPACGKAKLRRLIGTGAGLIFKGSGFYITDYRDASYKEKAKAESGGGDGKETKETKSSDSASTAGAAGAADAVGGASGDAKTPAASAAPVKAETAAPPKSVPKAEKGGTGGKSKSPKKD